MFKHCMTNILNFACQACLCIWPPRQTFVDKHILLVNGLKNIFCSSQAKNVSQAHVCVMAKSTNIMFDRQKFKCFSSNAFSFLGGDSIYWDTGCAIFLGYFFSCKINFWVYFVACNKFLGIVLSLE